MRKWYKYIVSEDISIKAIGNDGLYIDFLKGFDERERYLDLYFKSDKRLQYCDKYLSTIINRDSKILFIGSGRCEIELLFTKRGFDVTCSDIPVPFKDNLLRLFPELKYFEFDILKSPFREKFDFVISLSVFYQFNKTELFKVFVNTARSLNSNGRFILDVSGAADNLITFLIDEFICRYEAIFKNIVKSNFYRDGRYVIKKRPHGFRSTNKEIIGIAEKAGFGLRDLHVVDYRTELLRSIFIKRLTQKVPQVFYILHSIGRFAPYIRLFDFELNYSPPHDVLHL